MTSRQPGATPQDWLLRLLPLALLIILGLAGLRGAVATPAVGRAAAPGRLTVGLALEVVLAILARDHDQAHRIRQTRRRSRWRSSCAACSCFTLGAGAVAVAVATLVVLHLHLPISVPKHAGNPAARGDAPRRGRGRDPARGPAFHIPLAALLYALLIVVLLAGVVLSIWWARRAAAVDRRPGRTPSSREDSEDLREAVESGRSALRTVDDARAAIIACYVAMESSLAERGAARAIADTPDELLARATGRPASSAAPRPPG